ncbi:unnamed protein product [Boreogadus saida]
MCSFILNVFVVVVVFKLQKQGIAIPSLRPPPPSAEKECVHPLEDIQAVDDQEELRPPVGGPLPSQLWEEVGHGRGIHDFKTITGYTPSGIQGVRASLQKEKVAVKIICCIQAQEMALDDMKQTKERGEKKEEMFCRCNVLTFLF